MDFDLPTGREIRRLRSATWNCDSLVRMNFPMYRRTIFHWSENRRCHTHSQTLDGDSCARCCWYCCCCCIRRHGRLVHATPPRIRRSRGMRNCSPMLSCNCASVRSERLSVCFSPRSLGNQTTRTTRQEKTLRDDNDTKARAREISGKKKISPCRPYAPQPPEGRRKGAGA